ncbi:MAG TPA: tetratricopeptide repeat protein [Salinimicrobium sp.]|nr:tetratricopeptide repeat protein [Salinimicrobium sp.]
MKTRILTAALAMFTVVAFAQKKEIKRAGKSIEQGDFQEAKSYINEAEPLLSQADEDEKADFYLYKGQAFLGTGENVPVKDLMTAAEAFQKAKELGSEGAQNGITNVSNALVNSAIADQNAQNYAAASEKLYTSYKLNEQDTVYLYFAASNAVNAEDYDTALEYYEILKDLGYTGIETEYIAIYKETGEEEVMESKQQRDLFMKSGDYIQPSERKTESRRPEIAKNIALIYIQKGETDKAIAAMDDAKAENPNDPKLLQAEADMYYNLGNMEKYREIMEQVVAQNPENATLYYNLGVSSAELGDNAQAIEYYNKAIELEPDMTNARVNLAFVILSEEAPLIEQMNQLGTTAADNKKYDQLAEQRREIFRKALPHLQVVLDKNPENIDVARTMMNIYYQINEPENAEKMKQLIADLEAKQ